MFDGDRVLVWEERKVLEMDGGDGCMTLRMYIMPLNSTLKWLKWSISCYVYFTTQNSPFSKGVIHGGKMWAIGTNI